MRTDSPLVSIVVPCYNHEKYVQECLQSIIEQTYDNIELLVVDDGSSDNSVFQIEEMLEVCQKRFKRFEFIKQENKGLPATLNASLEWCQGKYYCVIASDDVMFLDRIKRQVTILEENEEFYACSGSQIKIDSQGVVLSGRFQKNLIKKIKVKTKENIFKKTNDIYSPTSLFRLAKVKALGGYNTEIQIEDLYIFYKAALHGEKHLQVSDNFTKYRVHDSNNHKRYLWMYENKKKILAEFEKSFECAQLEKLIMLESYYSLARYSDRNIARELFKKCLKYFYSPYFLIGTFYLIFRR